MSDLKGVEKYIEPWDRCCSNYCLHRIRKFSTLLLRDIYVCTQHCRGVYDDEIIDCDHYKLDLNHYSDVFAEYLKKKEENVPLYKKKTVTDETITGELFRQKNGQNVIRVVKKKQVVVVLKKENSKMITMRRHFTKPVEKKPMSDAEYEAKQKQLRAEKIARLQKEHRDKILETMITSFVPLAYSQMGEAQQRVESKIYK